MKERYESQASLDGPELYLSKRPVANPKLVNPDCVLVQLDLRRTEQRALITYAPHSWHRRVLFFLTLQVLEFHTHRAAHDRVAAPLSGLSHSLSLSLPITLFRSSAHVLTSPLEEPPIVLYSETSFCFILPSSPSLSRSLSLYGLLYIYALSSVPFVHVDCSHGQISNRVRCERRGERSEEGRTNPVKRRENRTIAEKKMRQ